ncbi:MAG: hypothetical protein ACTHNP_05620 [Solirubrobacterales bacterium]
MRPAWKSTTLLAVTAFLLCFAGCGGGSGGESTATLPKAQFLKKANAICAKKTAAMGKGDAAFWKQHGGPFARPPEALENELQLKVILPVREEELHQIKALGLPQGSEQRMEKILRYWEEGVEKGKEDPRSMRAGGPAFAFFKAYSTGIAYGLTKCWLA